MVRWSSTDPNCVACRQSKLLGCMLDHPILPHLKQNCSDEGIFKHRNKFLQNSHEFLAVFHSNPQSEVEERVQLPLRVTEGEEA